MIDPISQLLDTLQNPAMRHAAMVHLPIALAVLGIPAALLAAIFAGRPAVRWTAVALFVAAAGTAWLAAQSGEDAHDGWTRQMTAAAYEMAEEHEERAEWAWPIALTVAGLLALGAVPNRRVRGVSTALAVLGSVLAAAWVGYTAHLGGRMVYEFGAGTPQPLTVQAEAPPAHPSGDASAALSAPPQDARAAFFRDEVFPVLEHNCFRCHNTAKPKARLDQTTIAGMLKGGVSGPAIVPGKPEESLLVKAARHEVEDLQMPPDEERLPEADLERLARWVREGAVWAPPPGAAAPASPPAAAGAPAAVPANDDDD